MSSFTTYSEIHRQQANWSGVIDALQKEEELHSEIGKEFGKRIWVFTGCGSSFHLAQTAAVIFEKITDFSARAVSASEILLYPELVFNARENYITVAFSRSGVTPEIVEMVKKTRKTLKIPVISVCCDSTSIMTRSASMALTFPFPSEQSTVMTGSFTSMLMSILVFALQATNSNQWIERLHDLPAFAETALAQGDIFIPPLIEKHRFDQFIFLAQGPLIGLAHEAALKMTLMAQVHARSYHTLEFRRGPVSITNANTLVTILGAEKGIEHQLQMAEEVKSLGATVLLLHDHTLHSVPQTIESSICVPGSGHDVINALIYMPLVQLLAFYTSIQRGFNPDLMQTPSHAAELK